MNTIDMLWVMICSILVFSMQSGFLCLEAGLTRAKNSISVALKNISDFSISSLSFWMVGYAIMFGRKDGGGISFEKAFLNANDYTMEELTFFVFQIMFCGTTVTIISGAVAERMKFFAYLLVAFVVALVIYPVFGHLAWSLPNELNVALLEGVGFIDFAGGTVVHATGAWVALALLLIIGPRKDRFDTNGIPRKQAVNDMSMAMLGALILFAGFFGFNGGSALRWDRDTISIILNTMFSCNAGMIAALIYSISVRKYVDVILIINGGLAGLISVTAGVYAFSIFDSCLVGACGFFVMLACSNLLLKLKIDDAVGVIPVHGACGAWGCLAVALFGNLDVLGTGLNRIQQFGVQILGVGLNFIWAFGSGYLIFKIIHKFYPLRVNLEDEEKGLNISEHKATSIASELLSLMEKQIQTQDLTLRAPEEAFTEIGQISKRYNEVLSSLEKASAELLDSEKKNRAIINSSFSAIIISDSNGVIERSNPAVEKLFEISSEELKGKIIFNTLFDHSKGNNSLSLKKANIDKNTGHIFEIKLMRSSSKKIFYAELFVTKVTLGNDMETYVYYINDINKKKENEIKEKLTQKQLLEASRYAGKAEIATSVLHNVGNVLNCINASSDLMQKIIWNTKLKGFHKVSQLILENKDSLQDYMTEDPKGKLLPEYLTSLSGQLEEEQQQINDEMKIISKNINHIKDIVSAQQSFAGISNVIEDVNLLDIFNDALKINQASLDRHQVNIHKNIDETLSWRMDRNKVLQILTNLISNAKHALKSSGRDDAAIECSAKRLEDDSIQIEVSDNGIGIKKEDLDNIFSYGFTTKKEGHGFGLHSCVLAAKEMGGELLVTSEGEKTGASFKLKLPLEELL